MSKNAIPAVVLAEFLLDNKLLNHERDQRISFLRSALHAPNQDHGFPLRHAMSVGKIETIKWLLEIKADPSACSSELLSRAKSEGYNDAVEIVRKAIRNAAV